MRQASDKEADATRWLLGMKACRGKWMKSLNLMQGMGQARIAHAAVCSNSISNCRAQSWPWALQLLATWAWKQKADLVIWNSALRSCESGAWQWALLLLQEMEARSVQSDVVSCSAAIGACGKGSWQLALHVFHQLCNKKLVPDARLYSSVISACGKSRDWRLAMWLWDDAHKRHTEIDVVFCNMAINVCDKAAAWPAGLAYLDQMRQSALSPDVTSCSTAISACSQWRDAQALFHVMPQHRLQPNTITYNAAIFACAQASQGNMALGLLKHLTTHSGFPDIITFNTAISACDAGETWESSLCLLDTMQFAQVTPNQRTYSAVINSCGKSTNWQQAWRLFAKLRGSNSQLSPVTCNAAITALAKESQWQLAVGEVARMQQAGPEPTSVSYIAAISCCESAGEWQWGLHLLQDAQETGAADVTVYSATMGSCGAGGQWRWVAHLLGDMKSSAMKLDVIACNAALAAFARCGSWGHALQIIRDMAACELQAGRVSFNSAILACQRTERWAEAVALLSEMVCAKIPPDLLSFTATFSTCEARGVAVSNLCFGFSEELLEGEPWDVFLGLHLLARAGKSIDARRKLKMQEKLALCDLRSFAVSDLGALLWSMAFHGIQASSDILHSLQQCLHESKLPWQMLGQLDFALDKFRCTTTDPSAVWQLEGLLEETSALAPSALALASSASTLENAAPADLLLGLDTFSEGAGISVLVAEDPKLAEALASREYNVQQWNRMSTDNRLATLTPPSDSLFDHVILRLFGIQSQRGGSSLRLVLTAVAPLLSTAGSLWVCGLEEEGIHDARSVLTGFQEVTEITRRGSAAIYRARLLVTPPTGSLHDFRYLVPLYFEVTDRSGWVVWPGLFAGGTLDVMTAFLLRQLPQMQAGSTVLDFCCGSGCIARALCDQYDISVHMCDADAFALDAARHNVAEARNRCFLGDGWRSVPEDLKFDVIISNPPVHSRMQEDFRVIQELILGAAARLKDDGCLHLVTQVAVPLRGLLLRHGFTVQSYSDGRFVHWIAKKQMNCLKPSPTPWLGCACCCRGLLVLLRLHASIPMCKPGIPLRRGVDHPASLKGRLPCYCQRAARMHFLQVACGFKPGSINVPF